MKSFKQFMTEMTTGDVPLLKDVYKKINSVVINRIPLKYRKGSFKIYKYI